MFQVSCFPASRQVGGFKFQVVPFDPAIKVFQRIHFSDCPDSLSDGTGSVFHLILCKGANYMGKSLLLKQ